MTTTRRLAAILAADVAGYSRLMAADEAGTLARFSALRSELIDPKIAQFKGRVVGSAGDSLLVEFGSAVDAVQCAVETQERIAARNADLPEDRRLAFRMGINLGDVIAEGETIHGDGVNVAARLERLAEPGAIVVSRSIRNQVKDKLPYAFADLGEHALKNIAEPVRAFRVAPVDRRAALVPTEDLSPPAKPTIAVLPFNNMSGDPEQEYFSDGITEDIITELSRFKNLFVIARNSSFHYKGTSPKVQDIARELGVAYVVEGSVRKAGQRIRITAQLVEAATGNHLWAERYDRMLEDIFEVQDELVGEIAAAIPGQLDAESTRLARRRPVGNLTAYDYVLRAEALLGEDFGAKEAMDLFEKAIAIDPLCARAYTRMANYFGYNIFRRGTDARESTAKACALAEKALAIAPADPTVHGIAATTYVMVGQHDLARQHIDKAIALNRNDYLVMSSAGITVTYLGEPEEGLRWHMMSTRHDPFAGDAYREGRFDAHYMMRRYDDAIATFGGWRRPPPHMYGELAAAYAQSGRMDEARAALARYEESRPEGFDTIQVAQAHARMCARAEDHDHWLQGYRKAGLIP